MCQKRNLLIDFRHKKKNGIWDSWDFNKAHLILVLKAVRSEMSQKRIITLRLGKVDKTVIIAQTLFPYLLDKCAATWVTSHNQGTALTKIFSFKFGW